jgi:hypothetical protein
MPWLGAGAYSLAIPTSGTPRAAGENEVTKFTKVDQFIDDASALLDQLIIHTQETTNDNVHGLPSGEFIVEGDARLTDERTPANSSVSTSKILNQAVGTAQLADNSVTAAKIPNDAVGTAEIATNAVTNTELALNAVQSTNIQAGAVGNTQLASNIDGAKLLDDSVDLDKIHVDNPVDLNNPEMFLNATGVWAVPPYPEWTGGTVTRGSQIKITVASSTASHRLRSIADYECDGSSDQETLNTALTHANTQFGSNGTFPAFGAVEMSSGMFYCDGPTLIPGRGTSFYGQGHDTILAATTSGGSKWGFGMPTTIKALIKMDVTAAAQNWPVGVSIHSMTLQPGGMSFPLSFTDIDGIYLRAHPNLGPGGVTEDGRKAAYGFPFSVEASDGMFDIHHINILGPRMGLYIQSTDDSGNASEALRGSHISNINVQYMRQTGTPGNQAGIWIELSDCFLEHSTAGSTGSGSPYGFHIASGNAFIDDCKAWYCAGPSSWGFNFPTARPNISNIEAQDCKNGIRVSGAQNVRIQGFRVDNQVGSAAAPNDARAVGMDISGIGSGFNISGGIIHQRAVGAEYATAGLILPTAGNGIINETLVDSTNGIWSGRVVQLGAVASEATALGTSTYGRVDKRNGGTMSSLSRS